MVRIAEMQKKISCGESWRARIDAQLEGSGIRFKKRGLGLTFLV